MAILPEQVRIQVVRHIRAARQNRGISRERVAKFLYLRVEIIDDFEEGRVMLSSAELQRLCRWFGLNVYAVFRPHRPTVVASNVIGARPTT